MIELFVIVLVVAVLATIAVPQLAQVAERRRVSQAVARFDVIKKAEAMHYSLHGSYTASVAALAVEAPEVDDGVSGQDDGQWVYAITMSSGINPSYMVTATRVAGKGMPGSLVWDSAAGTWSGTHPLRPR
jgi:Tfp pilus assembly protein PilE